MSVLRMHNGWRCRRIWIELRSGRIAKVPDFVVLITARRLGRWLGRVASRSILDVVRTFRRRIVTPLRVRSEGRTTDGRIRDTSFSTRRWRSVSCLFFRPGVAITRHSAVVARVGIGKIVPILSWMDGSARGCEVGNWRIIPGISDDEAIPFRL